MCYVRARAREGWEAALYRVYLTDALHAAFGLDRRYQDLIGTAEEPPLSPGEVKTEIREKWERCHGSAQAQAGKKKLT